MTIFPDHIKFKYSWRAYQKRFLDNLDEYLANNHLHVTAPPGSGKTVLGLEVMLRLNKPALIVAPTLAVKNQWVQRFCELFLDTETIPDWISTDIKNPRLITVTTYQGIHAASGHPEDDETEDDKKSTRISLSEMIKKLQKQKVKTFIFDEAHHLKNAWWRSLMELKAVIDPTVVSLTATPPFDVSGSEWQKYLQLNGPIDTEISVPELMIEGDLCPHQDLVYFTLPSYEEQQKIEHYHSQAEAFLKEIENDDVLLNALEQHPVYQNPMGNLEWIYENISSYTSGLIYLHFSEKEISKIHFEIIGDQHQYIPEFDFFWLEELLDFYLIVDEVNFKNNEEHRTALGNRLKRQGFLEKKTISFFNNKNVSQILNSSIGKLQGIKDIVEFEFFILKEDLKMVILTDFIKKEYLTAEATNNLQLDKIGAVPIFEKLRRDNLQNKKIGVLTGGIVIIPVSAKEKMNELCIRKGISGMSFSPITYDKDYIQINLTEQIKHDIVHIITEIFQQGYIQVLIGTKALLGEGWDAPKMNTLILASFVSSFVLSNQMRGRVIRIDKDTPQKTGNIWHLACFDPQSEQGGQDMDIVKRRFKTFVGISTQEETSIENNFERLHIKTIEREDEIPSINQESFSLAKNREALSQRWKSALDKGNILVEEIKVPSEDMTMVKDMKMTYLGKMTADLSKVMISSVLLFWQDLLLGILKNIQGIDSVKNLSWIVFLLGALGLVIYGGKFYRALKQYLKYKNVAGHMGLIGEIVLKCLIYERIITTAPEKMKVVSSGDKNNMFCYLDGGSYYEKSQFIQVLQEVISKIDNPRYLLKQQTQLFFTKKYIYYPVPEVFARNKKSADLFAKSWSEKIEKSELIFTRTIEGRRTLLQLRFQSLLKRNGRIEHLHKWTR
ncbi:DEAD/DEAH box helicase family protein [Chryseobacterium sp. RP-3-3]|uniref:DEAD/DEAH box helicase family protein n=1 Tax=Chryseobacterium antibioticum TaxID=2728847 RepID=A0A7Y0AN37_9FLAO|nr:DEAD/DEAH box helicase family protein [Chryseobacterium antibioticum]NML70262.1 DEAD/DEAH box helicase family protein [Chryseobacterium antibioticum]